MPLSAPGQPARPGQPRFSEAEIAAIVEYTRAFTGDEPPIPQVRSGGDVRRGWELYTANCAACHAASGVGNAIGGGYVASNLGRADPRTIIEATEIGPGAMPVFSFDEHEQADLVAYIQFLSRQPHPGGLPIGGTGPVAEGFVAVVIGLTALVAVTMFVGRHRRGPLEPVEAGPSVAPQRPPLDEETEA
jgi:ubiquinol-cytochrome c reductase cytochrome c subunit